MIIGFGSYISDFSSASLMDFEIGTIFIIGYLLSLSKSQARFHVYYSAPGQEYQRIYTLSGNQWAEYFNAGQTTYPPYSYSKNVFWYFNNSLGLQNLPKYKTEAINTSRYVLANQKNYPIQYGHPVQHAFQYVKKFNMDFDYQIHNNEIGRSRNKDFRYISTIYFEEYPHLKSLLKYQKTRRDNKLPPLKLKSLRLDSPYFRF